MRPTAALGRLPTQLAVPTRSPWVYVLRGIEANLALPPSARVNGLRAEFITPESLKYKLPTDGRPEFAFIGRSNVGKSTLVGNLLKSSKLVRTSKVPGCTKTVNFFAIRAGPGLPFSYLVDLPGYGFARHKREAVRQWTGIVRSYLGERSPKVLKRVFVLVDSRRGMQKEDQKVIEFLDDMGVSNQVVLTKIDKANPAELYRTIEGVFQSILLYPTTFPAVHCVSAHKELGVVELTNTMHSLA